MTVEFEFPSFHTISHQLKANFTLKSGPEQRVMVTGNRNVLHFLERESYVADGVLYLGFESCVGDYQPLEIEITLPEFIAFTNNGFGNGTAGSQLNTGDVFSIVVGGTGDLDLMLDDLTDISIQLTGSGNINLSGSVINQSITITGNGVVDCFDLSSLNTSVLVQGNSSCLVSVADSLNVQIVGNGKVYYKGYPFIQENITGGGELIDAN